MNRNQGIGQALAPGLVVCVLDQLDQEPAVVLGADMPRSICELNVVVVPVRDARDDRVQATAPKVTEDPRRSSRSGTGEQVRLGRHLRRLLFQ